MHILNVLTFAKLSYWVPSSRLFMLNYKNDRSFTHREFESHYQDYK